MPDIIYLKDYQRMSQIAADIVQNTVGRNRHTNLGLPTGNTPIGMYKTLSERVINWSTVSTFNLDEYHDLAHDHPDSFHSYMQRHLWSFANVASSYWPSENYDDLIDRCGGLDLTILGIGQNGHIAYNEPGSSFDSTTRVVELSSSTRQQIAANFDDIVPQYAYTMGLSTIMSSRKILLMACGQHKLNVLRAALWQSPVDKIPASVLQYHRDLTVLYCD